jgi:hypothetical protein
MKTETKKIAKKLDAAAMAIRGLCRDATPELQAALLVAVSKVEAARYSLLCAQDVATYQEARRGDAAAPFAVRSLPGA